MNLLLVVLPFGFLAGPLGLYAVTLDVRISGEEFSARRYWGLVILKAKAGEVVVRSRLAVGARKPSIFFEVHGRRFAVDGKFRMYEELAMLLESQRRHQGP